LSLLGRVVRLGLSIGSIAHLPESELIAILSREEEGDRQRGIGEGERDPARELIRRLLEAVHNLESRELNRVLDEGRVALGWQGLMERVISPAAEQVGHLWMEGDLSVAQEHFFSSAVKFHLGSRVHSYSRVRNGPRMVVGTPVGQGHELGAVLAAHAASHLGWEVAYVGSGLSAGELAGAVERFGAGVLCLSILFPSDDAMLREDLLSLGRLVAPGTRILAGGGAMEGYAQVLQSIGASLCRSMGEFCAFLEQIRREDPGWNAPSRPRVSHQGPALGSATA
jgi:methanogenic corrinoid protein MtbC1